MITDGSGAVKSRRDFMPFGEDLYAGVGGRTVDAAQRYATTQDDIRQKFMGYQKDAETQLDFAEARMYNNSHGRFTAVDPLLASGKSANPQSFNRYVYVQNSPLIATDPSGLCGGPSDPCPNNYSGSVFSKSINGVMHYNNKKLDDTWNVFTDSATINRNDSGTRTIVTQFGWREVNQNIQAFLGGFSQVVDDAQSGAAKGTTNAGVGFLNLLTQPLGPMGQAAGVPNPFALNKYTYNSLTEGKSGTAFDVGFTIAPSVAGGVFAGSASSLSVVPRSPSTLAGFGSDAAIIENSANLIPKKGGYDAVVHGTADGKNFAINGSVTTPNKFYEMMLENGYQPGTNIRLMSCFAGSCRNGAAQQLSTLAGAKVVAPADAVFVGGGGVFTRGVPYVSNGKWFNVFRPQ